MNWIDFVVIGIIALFAIIGFKEGFILTLFKISSFLISILVSIKLYPIIEGILIKTVLFSNTKASILKSLMARYSSSAGSQAKGSLADNIVSQLPLPGFFKQTLIEKVSKPDGILNVTGIMNTISDELTKVVFSIISFILVFVLVKIALVIVGILLKGITKMPVIKQMNNLGGFVFGALGGLLAVYILFAILMLFNTAPQFKQIFEATNSSLLAKTFYQNNFIISWMFNKG